MFILLRATKKFEKLLVGKHITKRQHRPFGAGPRYVRPLLLALIEASMDYLEDALGILNTINSEINKINCAERSDRLIYSSCLYSNALDHSRAIQSLLRAEVCSSAFALLRANFESYIRAAWLQHCASNTQIEIFGKNKGIKRKITDTKDIQFFELVKELEKKLEMPKYLSAIQRRSWSALNSYTHGGYHQVSRCIKEDAITNNFSREEKYEVMEFSLMLSGLSLAGVLSLYKVLNADEIAENLAARIVSWKEKHYENNRN